MLGSSMLAAASWSSSGSVGTSSTTRANWFCTVRVSASTSLLSLTTSGSCDELADRIRVVA